MKIGILTRLHGGKSANTEGKGVSILPILSSFLADILKKINKKRPALSRQPDLRRIKVSNVARLEE
jgi:hypothetical protein